MKKTIRSLITYIIVACVIVYLIVSFLPGKSLTEKSFKELGVKLKDEERAELKNVIENSRNALESNDLQVINDAILGLNNVTHKIAESLYSSVS